MKNSQSVPKVVSAGFCLRDTSQSFSPHWSPTYNFWLNPNKRCFCSLMRFMSAHSPTFPLSETFLDFAGTFSILPIFVFHSASVCPVG
ncbi:hypothetical protein cgR_5038 [Corynebacterium glutamicum R]|uniref:Uncharacterized protein n=1 Tax=Corynebacterium glutamicum (strain R) TaxID=340322 RepID=A0AB72VDU6_CORGB|nr:hypothetical protein cgR_5038 [Corynebacterium glutamicum R]